jgi:hypothetical protein
MLCDGPRRLPARRAVAAKVRREDVETAQAVLGQTAEARAVSADPVQAEDERCPRVAPLVHVQVHAHILPSPP